jgi:hypothetical protein
MNQLEEQKTLISFLKEGLAEAKELPGDILGILSAGTETSVSGARTELESVLRGETTPLFERTAHWKSSSLSVASGWGSTKEPSRRCASGSFSPG